MLIRKEHLFEMCASQRECGNHVKFQVQSENSVWNFDSCRENGFGYDWINTILAIYTKWTILNYLNLFWKEQPDSSFLFGGLTGKRIFFVKQQMKKQQQVAAEINPILQNK